MADPAGDGDIAPNLLKRALAAGESSIALWTSIPSAVTVEVIAGAGFDWVLIDMEHSPNDLPLVQAQLQAMMGYPDSSPVVRPPSNDTVMMKLLLDLGVQSFLIPNAQSADEAAAAVRSTRYRPQGVRGFASASRATSISAASSWPLERTCLCSRVPPTPCARVSSPRPDKPV